MHPSSRSVFPTPRPLLVRWAAAASAVIAVLAACAGGPDTAGPPGGGNSPTVNSVSITPAAATIRAGEQQPLSAVVDAINGAGTGVSWTSETPAVASVTASGVVTGVTPGNATIRATATADTRVSATATITVQSARGITISPAAVSLGAGQTQPLQASVVLDPGQATTVTWRSAAANIASVSATGVVTGVALGITTITAIATADSTLRTAVTVSVVPSVRAVAVTPTTASLFITATQQLTATVTADAGGVQTVSWRSSNPETATVSATGLVTAIALGTTTITVLSTADTTRRATTAITVSPRPITVAITQRNVGLNPGTSTTLTAGVGADPGVGTGVNWTSSVPAVATVSAQGVVGAVSLGTTLITATSTTDASRRDTVTIRVVPRLAASWSTTRLGGALRDDIVSIAAFSATNAFAVDEEGDIYRWNGTVWSPSLSGANNYLAIHGSSATNIIAVGTGGVISRWNGTSWNTMTSGTTRTLNAVWVEDNSTAWAVGGNGTILQLATDTWTTALSNSTQTLNGVWSGDNVVYAVGARSEVLRRTAGVWTRVTVPSAELLYGVHGNSATDVVVVGANGTLIRWNGTTWSVLGVGGFSGDLYQIIGSTANAGRRYFVGEGGLGQLDAVSATVVSTPYAPQLYGVSLDAAGALWTSGARGIVMRSADGAGSPYTTINLSPDLLDVWTTASNNAFAVGEFGSIYRWNGSTWTRLASPTQATLTTTWALSPTDAFVGGERGTMLRWNGTTWSTMTFPSRSTVSALWGTASTNVYATTRGGEVLRFNGTAWTVLATAAAPLWALFGASDADVYVVGQNGLALRLAGATFTPLAAPAPATLAGLWLTGSANVVAVGANASATAGVAYRFNGTAWSSLQPGTTRGLTSIWGPSEFDLYATGDEGTLLRYNGNSWSAMPTGTSDLLWSVSGAPNGSGGGFAVGENSTVVSASAPGAPAALRTDHTARAAGSLDPVPGTTLRRGALPRGVERKRRTSR
jgi:uncharacterized protein YjdB